MSKKHAMEMFQEKDEAHLKIMNDMQELMKKPEVMKGIRKKNLKHYLKSKKGGKATANNTPHNRMHADSRKRRSSLLVALLLSPLMPRVRQPLLVNLKEV